MSARDCSTVLRRFTGPEGAPVLRSVCHERGFDGFPCPLVEAALCRPELLYEAEAVAMLPPATAGAG